MSPQKMSYTPCISLDTPPASISISWWKQAIGCAKHSGSGMKVVSAERYGRGAKSTERMHKHTSCLLMQTGATSKPDVHDPPARLEVTT